MYNNISGPLAGLRGSAEKINNTFIFYYYYFCLKKNNSCVGCRFARNDVIYYVYIYIYIFQKRPKPFSVASLKHRSVKLSHVPIHRNLFFSIFSPTLYDYPVLRILIVFSYILYDMQKHAND